MTNSEHLVSYGDIAETAERLNRADRDFRELEDTFGIDLAGIDRLIMMSLVAAIANGTEDIEQVIKVTVYGALHIYLETYRRLGYLDTEANAEVAS